MSTLYLDRKNLALKLDGRALALYEEGTKRGTVPLKMLEKVVIRGNVELESRVLGAFAECAVDVLFLSARSGRLRTKSFSHSHNDVRRRLAQYRVYWDRDRQFELAGSLVLGKLGKQRQLIDKALSARPDLRKPLMNTMRSLDDIREHLLELPERSASMAQLRGFEGAAAASYFAGFKRLFAPSLAFERRTKRPPTDPVNACLSLGYTLLHFEAVAMCHMAGLEPMLGFYHEPSFGRESLACDLIEPLRPRLDDLVWSLFRERMLRPEHFSNDNDRCLLNKAGRKCFYARYELFVQPVRRLLRLQAHRLARFYLQSEPDGLP